MASEERDWDSGSIITCVTLGKLLLKVSFLVSSSKNRGDHGPYSENYCEDSKLLCMMLVSPATHKVLHKCLLLLPEVTQQTTCSQSPHHI